MSSTINYQPNVEGRAAMKSTYEAPRTTSIQACNRCTCTCDKISKTAEHSQTRIACPIPSCNSTFGRRSDLARHQKTIHGPKAKCGYAGCGYTTGRADKMAEHIRKIHIPADTDEVAQGVPTLGYSETEIGFEALPTRDIMDYSSTWSDGGCYQAYQDADTIDLAPFGTWGLAWAYADIHDVWEVNQSPVDYYYGQQ